MIPTDYFISAHALMHICQQLRHLKYILWLCNYYKGWRLLKWLVDPRYMRLKKGIPIRVVGTFFCEETVGEGRHLIDQHLLICNAYIIIKNLVQYADVILLFVSKLLQNQYLWFSKFPIYKNISIYQNRF